MTPLAQMLSLWCLLLGLLLGAGVQVSEAQAGGGSYKIASVEVGSSTYKSLIYIVPVPLHVIRK